MSDPKEFSFADPRTVVSPHAYYSAMRKHDPVHFDPAIGMWIVTRYDDVMEVAKQPLTFSRVAGFEDMMRKDYTHEIDELMIREGLGPFPLAISEPPHHTRIRALMQKGFSTKRVFEMEASVLKIVNELIECMQDKGEAEIMGAFAIPIPMHVIADQLGVARSDLDKFKRWSTAAVEPMSGLITRERAFECAREMIELQYYLKAIIDDRRAHPQDDMISDLVHATLADEDGLGDLPALNQTELFSVIRGILVAGNETTTNGIANSLRLLAEHPEAAATLYENIDDDRTFMNFVEEVLRLEAPVPNLFRTATVDTSIGGVSIPRGSQILVAWASANCDEAKFDCPAKFDPARPNANTHLAFGFGIYRCIGQALARMEMKIAIREFLRKFEQIEFAAQAAAITYIPSLVTHGPSTLHLRYKKRII